MKAVYKFTLGQIGWLTGVVHHRSMPVNAKIVHVGMQASMNGSVIQLWVELDIDPSQGEVERLFRVLATGEEFDFKGEHVGTVMQTDFVWHVYEVLS